jgi:hypothetical protein
MMEVEWRRRMIYLAKGDIDVVAHSLHSSSNQKRHD